MDTQNGDRGKELLSQGLQRVVSLPKQRLKELFRDISPRTGVEISLQHFSSHSLLPARWSC